MSSKKPSELATVDRLSSVSNGERYLVWEVRRLKQTNRQR